MAGGDLKALVMAAMGSPFAPPYSKAQALAWALQAAEALHYLHAVCRPMIIHRDLKLDNLLLSSSNPGEATVRARMNVSQKLLDIELNNNSILIV